MDFGTAPNQLREKMFQLENHTLKNNPPGNSRLTRNLNKLARREARRKADEIRRRSPSPSDPNFLTESKRDDLNVFATKRARAIMRLQ